jgi:hypothetical protein
MAPNIDRDSRSRHAPGSKLLRYAALTLLVGLLPVSLRNAIYLAQFNPTPVVIEIRSELLTLPIPLPPTLPVQHPCIDPSSTAVVPVALFGSEKLDVNEVDTSQLRLNSAAPFQVAHTADTDGDGYADMLALFRLGDIGIKEGDTVVILTGLTFKQALFQGSAPVSTGPLGICGE